MTTATGAAGGMKAAMDASKAFAAHPERARPKPYRRALFLALLLFAILHLAVQLPHLSQDWHESNVPLRAAETLARCRALNSKPGPPPTFSSRVQSDRFQEGTKPILIRNATIWTGRLNGSDVVLGDVYLDNGIVKSAGQLDLAFLENVYSQDIEVLDAQGAWVTPGIVDVHSHIAVESSPGLNGASDGNSVKGLALPWLRSVDGMNTHDASYEHSIAGGITTSLILPGSADAIGGQAFVIKLRPTKERSTSSLLLEPPFDLNNTSVDYSVPPRWRHMKHACGENPSRVYSGTRMDTVWGYREVYDTARKIKGRQDNYCSKAIAGEWDKLGEFPEDLQWEAAVDVLRGKVKVQTHCYEAVDFDAFVRVSNEFQFPVAAFHHAHEAYLVPDVLKRAYEHPPALAMFASFSRYKREAYRHSEYAPRILNDNGLKVVMKSDHPAIQSRYLVHEAQQAHYYGLPANVALASVTSTAAEVLGLDHRIGFVKEGHDPDLVIWDSHPLALGATPVQVIIDGIPQIKSPHFSVKPESQVPPTPPSFDQEAEQTLDHVGLPPLFPSKAVSSTVVFRNVSSMWVRGVGGITPAFQTSANSGALGDVVVYKGRVVCSGTTFGDACASFATQEGVTFIDLKGGSVAPALVSTATALGLGEIGMEESTGDGEVLDPFEKDVPLIAGGDGSITRAVDGLQFGTRNALLAYRAGVTSAITAPSSHGFLGGLSAHLSLGSKHRLDNGAVIQDIAAVHVTVGHTEGASPSISTQIAALRNLLTGKHVGERGEYFEAVAEGSIPLVVNAKSADVIASLLALKKEVENQSQTGAKVHMTIVGGAEAHLLARELAEADVGVIVTPPRSFPYTWESRRVLLGPPVTADTTLSILAQHNVTVGLGPQGISEEALISSWAARNLRWDAAWAALDSHGMIDFADALTMASVNVETLLGVRQNPADTDLVATSGGDLLSFEGKVVAVISPRRGLVDIL
ncbi:hypothetical protein CONPUDRAFT_164126 [Coniophora puteana RWD-64-598 SS2]|uniref:Amidohydrolase-related domain-containing protein n=1 Tax=Coniophora puteana (strain RWD-64-598) TaxID=741705 RepID=A0A5M3MVD2_CONPW|nr:uncharacterized protein CONPUDRAFT_164126 [Coniophora puteana RWD-64-598 SS2]EIW83128.1 hypothetical protein CONPUDRAFT_164126 [Coniophora puteana RWD-64-598 SS2]